MAKALNCLSSSFPRLRNCYDINSSYVIYLWGVLNKIMHTSSAQSWGNSLGTGKQQQHGGFGIALRDAGPSPQPHVRSRVGVTTAKSLERSHSGFLASTAPFPNARGWPQSALPARGVSPPRLVPVHGHAHAASPAAETTCDPTSRQAGGREDKTCLVSLCGPECPCPAPVPGRRTAQGGYSQEPKQTLDAEQ